MDANALLTLKGNEKAMRDALESVGVQFRGPGQRTCRCPFHEDRTASAGIFLKDGIWFFKCHGCQFGGDIIDVRAKVNKRTPAEELSGGMVAKVERPPTVYPSIEALTRALPNVEDQYADLYADATGEVGFFAVRWRNAGKKCFTQCARTGGGWIMRAPSGVVPIANRKGIADASEVVLVEGEKCVRLLTAVGLVATTTPGGALNSHKADLSPLAGKIVYLWPDHDAPEEKWPLGKGVEHMRQVQATLQKLNPPAQIFWIDPDRLELPPGGDVVDFCERYKGWSDQEIKGVIQDLLFDARPVGVAADFAAEQEAMIAGKMKNHPWPWNSLSHLARALMPGTVTCLCGDPGATKSFLILPCLKFWHDRGIKAACYMLEEDTNYHLRRLLAIEAGNAELTDPAWVEANPEAARVARRAHSATLEAVGRMIWDAPETQLSYEDIEMWVEARAKDGCEIICIDPITAVEAGMKPWIDDQRFIFKLKTIARRKSLRIVLVTHATKLRSNKGSLADQAGGAAFTRFSQTALWIDRLYPDESGSVKVTGGAVYLMTYNRQIKINKARNGKGTGLALAFRFDADTLRFEELGVIQ